MGNEQRRQCQCLRPLRRCGPSSNNPPQTTASDTGQLDSNLRYECVSIFLYLNYRCFLSDYASDELILFLSRLKRTSHFCLVTIFSKVFLFQPTPLSDPFENLSISRFSKGRVTFGLFIAHLRQRSMIE